MSTVDSCSINGQQQEEEEEEENAFEEFGDNELEEMIGNVASTEKTNNFPLEKQFEDLKELKVTQSTLEYLTQEGYKFSTRRELPSAEVDILMFSHPFSLHLLKSFPYVVVIDGTYKIKRNGMSLVKMVGYTSIYNYKPFNIAFAFTKGESIPHYLFIMRRLEKLYADLGVKPTAIVTDLDYSLISAIGQVFGDTVKHLLCWTHIKQKIKSYARSVIKKNKDMVEAFTDECCELFSSTTEEMYLEGLQELRDGLHSALVGHVETTWLNPFKENIIRAWTDRHLHFFIPSKKRVKMISNSLKHDLESTQHDFNSIIRIIHSFQQYQSYEMEASIEKEHIMCLTAVHYLPPFAPIIRKVTETCLRMLLDMYYDISKGKISGDCNHEWWRTCYGLPCIHRIRAAILFNTPIMPSEMHLFWRQTTWWKELKLKPNDAIPRGVSKVAYDSSTVNSLQGPNMSESQNQEINEVIQVPIMYLKHCDVKFPAESVDYFMFSFIIDARSMVIDGHCGYRCLGLHLGWHEYEYVRVRMDIASELVENKELYMNITQSIADYDSLLGKVNYLSTPCPEAYWMEMPIAGLAFATRFHVALVHIDWNGGCLCLPMKASSENDKPPEKIMSIASIKRHFVPVWLSDDAPIPPISKYWHKFKHPSVDGWDKLYEDRIEKWRSSRVAVGRSPEPLL